MLARRLGILPAVGLVGGLDKSSSRLSGVVQAYSGESTCSAPPIRRDVQEFLSGAPLQGIAAAVRMS